MAVVIYVLANEVFLFRSVRFLANVDDEVVAIIAVSESSEALYVKSLAVSPRWRRRGAATFMLGFAYRLARKLNKKWVDLGVLKANTNAQKLCSIWLQG